MNKLVYIYVPNEFVIGYVLLTLLIKRLAVALVNKTVVLFHISYSFVYAFIFVFLYIVYVYFQVQPFGITQFKIYV
jgi:hypothetical protein